MNMRKTVLWLFACLLTVFLSGCGSGGDGSESMSPRESSEIAGSPEAGEPADAGDEASPEAVEAASADSAEPLEGATRFYFTVSYMAEDSWEKSAIFSFDLPEGWSFTASPYQVQLREDGTAVGQIELQGRAEDLHPLFSDIDAMDAEAYDARDLTISGAPARLYALKDSAEATDRPSLCFYIAPDEIPDAYVIFSFLPGAGTASEPEAVVSSFLVDQEWAAGGTG